MCYIRHIYDLACFGLQGVCSVKRIQLKDRSLPDYTKGEEIFNMSSHITGAALGIVALVLCVVFAALHDSALAVISAVIYGVTMTVLYTMSSVYHGLNPKLHAKKVLQVLDHCSIFLLIAGSYTPFCLVTFVSVEPVTGWVMFGVIWAMAILGITLNSIDLERYKIFSMICYLFMGWCIIMKAPLLPHLLGKTGFLLLLSGGIAYTAGAVFYAFGRKKRYFHSIFHLFIVLGSLLHFFCILLYVI